MNIFEINSKLLSIIDEIEENEGEITPEIAAVLQATKENFNEKVKNYVNVIKTLENDIRLIKEEKDRLSNIQKSKEKTIDKLKDILVETTKMFGSETKSGGLAVDYGFGKIHIRKSEVVELDADTADKIVREFNSCMKLYSMQHMLDSTNVTKNDIIEYIKNTDDLNFGEATITNNDLSNLRANISLNIDLDKLTDEEGLALLANLYEHYQFDIKANVSKTDIKYSIKNGINPIFANLVEKENIIIK